MNIRSTMRRVRAFTLIPALLLVAIAAPLAVASAAAQDTGITTRVQFLHAGTDLGEVELFINGDNELDEFGYGDQSDWIELDPGSVQVTLTVDRAGINYAIFDAVYPVPAGNDYFAVITDDLLITGVFDTSSVALQGSRIQIVHASVDTPPVTVVASGENVDLATQLGFARTSEPAPLPSGTYDLEVNLAETGENALTVPGVVIEDSKSYVLVLTGEPGNEDEPLAGVLLETDLVEDTAATPGS
jgi:Domain of unknown function (DUF4397)